MDNNYIYNHDTLKPPFLKIGTAKYYIKSEIKNWIKFKSIKGGYIPPYFFIVYLHL